MANRRVSVFETSRHSGFNFIYIYVYENGMPMGIDILMAKTNA